MTHVTENKTIEERIREEVNQWDGDWHKEWCDLNSEDGAQLGGCDCGLAEAVQQLFSQELSSLEQRKDQESQQLPVKSCSKCFARVGVYCWQCVMEKEREQAEATLSQALTQRDEEWREKIKSFGLCKDIVEMNQKIDALLTHKDKENI